MIIIGQAIPSPAIFETTIQTSPWDFVGTGTDGCWCCCCCCANGEDRHTEDDVCRCHRWMGAGGYNNNNNSNNDNISKRSTDSIQPRLRWRLETDSIRASLLTVRLSVCPSINLWFVSSLTLAWDVVGWGKPMNRQSSPHKLTNI